MYWLCILWKDDYSSMLKFPDGEWRNPVEKNDYSDETAETKIK